MSDQISTLIQAVLENTAAKKRLAWYTNFAVEGINVENSSVCTSSHIWILPSGEEEWVQY